MAVTDVSLASNALQRLGAKSISSFTQNTDRSRLAANVYKFRVNYILAAYPWKFTLDYQQLAKDPTAPIAAWANRFTLPAPRLQDGMFAVYDTNSAGANTIKEYEVLGEFLHTDRDAIFVAFQKDVDEDLWPKYFQELIIKVLMVEFAMPITDQKTMREALYTEVFGTPNENGVGGLFGLCMARNSQESPPKSIADFTLITVRG